VTGERSVDASAPIRVVLACDDADVLAQLPAALGRMGLEVDVAPDRDAALRAIATARPDLVVIDLAMAAVTVEDVRREKATAPTRPLVVLCRPTDLRARLEAFDAGADELLARPFHIRELADRIDCQASRLRAGAALRRTRKDAEYHRVLSSEAAALLAHDLNNGLAILKCNFDFLREQLDAGDPEVADAVGAGDAALTRMIALVRNFVDVSRVEEVALRPRRSRVPVRAMATMVARIHMARRSTSDVEVAIDVDSDLTAEVDPGLLERILHTLLTNSARYVPRGGRILITADLEPGEGGPTLVLGVGNSGPAIPAAARSRLFDDHPSSPGDRGRNGRGLYFCRLAAEAHGGSIALGAAPDLGAFFELRLPSGAARATAETPT
jgi:signal transduction histidine kinase